MQISVVKVPIKRDPMEVIQTSVGEHIVPILKLVHGEDAVSDEAILPTDDTVEVLDAKEEYQRLAMLYGAEPETRRLNVDVAYGSARQFETALKALAKAAKK